MAVRGRPPTPTNLRLLNGNPGRRPINTTEPRPPAEAPEPPKFLSAKAKRMFIELAAQLVDVGTVTQIDGLVLADYCDAAVEVERLTKALKHGDTIETPNGYIQAHPYVAMRNQCFARMARAGAELGIGAASRTRVKTDVAGGKKSRFRDYLNHGKKQGTG